MASIQKRTRKDGTSSLMVCWRDPKCREQQGITVASETEAETLKRLLDAIGQSVKIAQHALPSNEARVPTVAEVVQERNNLLIRPSSVTTRTYQMILDMPTDQEGTLKAKERECLKELQRDGRWAHLWGVVGEYSNCSVFDVAENDEHLLLSGLPLVRT
ncbi:muconolactone Delta-isomerase family protein [Pseudarthrobacter sulfonivorans]|uniref:muconolactone Delta-isomerase family protein n=1 Tax=Pseudarthrobacter sulfonivorans TaxID=121292 RepID=UPI001F0AB66F|nr:muconolactone Delta-isomerase family protein [Pseudarthrobacter sulfonivorans]